MSPMEALWTGVTVQQLRTTSLLHMMLLLAYRTADLATSEDQDEQHPNSAKFIRQTSELLFIDATPNTPSPSPSPSSSPRVRPPIASQAESTQARVHLLAATMSSAPRTARPLRTLHLLPLLCARSRSKQVATPMFSHPFTDLLPRQLVTTSLDFQLAFGMILEVLHCLAEKANLPKKSVE